MIALYYRPRTRATRFIFLLGELGAGPWMLGERFSALDVLYGTTFAMCAQSPMLPKSAAIEAWIQRVVARPAFQAAQRREQADA